jgi:ubiquinone/menaquinone biosynthesis C-methylase UbiE
MTKIQKSEESYIKNIFESISKDYDLMNDLITFKYHSKWKY